MGYPRMLSALNPKGNLQAFRELLMLLTRHRQLTIEMAKREISDRYAGQVLGIMWTIGHPLMLMAVYVVVFAFIFKMRVGGTADMPLGYTAYLLAGLIPWMTFQEVLAKASTVIVYNANIVKQVVFPIEVLPVKSVLATFVTLLVFLGLYLVYVLLAYQMAFWTWLVLPALVLLQGLAMIGASYVLSAVGAYFRDVKDLVQVFTVVNIYLMPVFYLPDFAPAPLRVLLFLNPFSHLIWCYQDVLYFGRMEHPYAWLVFPILSLSVFVIGYRLFRKLRVMFGNVL